MALPLEHLFAEETRRNPYRAYDALRKTAPALHDPASGLWLVFDYDSVKRALNDTATFSSQHGPDWLIFNDAPRHTKLRALVMRAFTPRMVANLEGRIRAICRELLDQTAGRGEMDLAADFAVPLPMIVIAEMLGIPGADRLRFKRWTDVILFMSYTVPGGKEAAQAVQEFSAITAEMDAYLAGVLEQRRAAPGEDLLSGLAGAELDGDRLTRQEILGFFQLLLLAGSETTTNLINNAVLCFLEHPDQLAQLKAEITLLPAAIEEVLRFRSPLQWMYRKTLQAVELHGQTIPAGKLVLAVIGSANRDPKHFPDPDRFDIERTPNPHLAFGHGVHFCLGAALARLEARIALTELLERCESLELASSAPWEPRKGLHVLGPARLPVRFQSAGPSFASAA